MNPMSQFFSHLHSVGNYSALDAGNMSK